MSSLGIWLWSSPQSFGASEAATCVTKVANLTVLGAHVPFGSQVLRIISISIYSLLLLPGLNLLLPMALFLSLHCWYHSRRSRTESGLPHHAAPSHNPPPLRSPNSQVPPSPSTLSSQRSSSLSALTSLRSSSQNTLNSQALQSPTAEGPFEMLWEVLPVYLGLLFLLAVNVIFIMDIELTLRRNAHLQITGELEWGFGQILALLLIFMPLRDLVEALYRRRQEMQTKLDNALGQAIRVKDLEEISRWIAARADPNVTAEGKPSQV